MNRSTSSRPLSLAALAALAAFATLGCRNLSSFDSKPGEAYCGPIVGFPAFHEGFVETDSPPDLQVALRLETGKLSVDPESKRVVILGSLLSNDPEGMCGTKDSPKVLFDGAPLRAIPEVEHDVLSALSFGEGHEQDFFAWVDSTCQGTMLAIVSLMKNNQVELRLFKPAPLAATDASPAEKPGFAVFHLDPKPLHQTPAQNGCGFPE